MIIREIEKKDNKEVENLIRTCLIEYGADKPGCAWSDPNLGSFFELYQGEKSKYWVVEKDNKVVAGCGIGPLIGANGVCELQKMYAFKEVRGSGIASKLLDRATPAPFLEPGGPSLQPCRLMRIQRPCR